MMMSAIMGTISIATMTKSVGDISR